MKYKIIAVAISLAFIVGYLFQNKQWFTQEKATLSEAEISTQQTTQANRHKANPPLQEPTPAQLTRKAQVIATEPEELPAEIAEKREQLDHRLLALLHCDETDSCPIDDSDSRGSDLLLGKMIATKLIAYQKLHQQQDYYDEETAQIVKTFISNSDGHVQEVAIDLMSAMPANEENAKALITTLETSYDAKIMTQALKELRRYPELTTEIDQLLASTLTTGSFYVAQEVALNILPYLHEENIQNYVDIAYELPQNSKRANALLSNINEFRLRQMGG